MPKAVSRLEILQICKLLQCVREKDKHQIEKLITFGVPHLINYNDPDEGNTALSVAAASNDEDMISFLLELGAHPDVMDLKGRTAAMRAAEYGHVICLEKLLAAGANMTLNDLEGKGIIFYCIASTQRHTKCLELVLANGAIVNNIGKNGIPVFVLACEDAGEIEHMCLTLLDKGADPNSRVEPSQAPVEGIKRTKKTDQELKTGKTALMSACGSGSIKVVKALLNLGAGVNLLDVRKNHAAHFAAKGGHVECLMCLSGFGAIFDQINMEGNSPIHLAAMGGHAMCCKYLSQRGCNPKTKNNDGCTARIIAKDEGHKEATKELRKAEKNFGKVGKNNEPWALTFYDWLVQNQEKVLQLLKQFDLDETGTVPKEDFYDAMTSLMANIEDEELKKLVALHDKSRDGPVDYNEFLSAKKWINKNYLNAAFEGKKKKKGKKAKRGGKKKGKFRLIMPICTQESGPRTTGGGPPESFIPRSIHFTDTVRFDRDHPPIHPMQDDSAWYIQHPERTYVNINDAAKMGDFDSLKIALQREVPIDTRDKYYKTPLMAACGAGHFAMAKFLVENGASVNTRDNFKWTPLHHACHAGQIDIVQLLVEHGGEIDATTMNGGTPLTRAIESSRDTVVQYLIDHGVKMQTENKKGMNPLDIALSWADPRVFDIVHSKWETLPPLDKKKAGKGVKGGGAKRPVTAPGHKEGEIKVKSSLTDEFVTHYQKGSILRAASALASGRHDQEDITYIPLKSWTKQATTEELIHLKEIKRERFGWEVDFPDFQMPFNKNVSTKMAELDAET